MSKFILIFCLFFSVSATAQQSFWNETNGPSGGSSEFAFNSHGIIYNNSGTHLRRSSDDGLSWQDITPSFMKGFPDGFTVLNDYLYIMEDGILYRSTDDGLNFEIMMHDNLAQYLYTAPGVLYILGRDATHAPDHITLKRSTDDGTTWSDLSSHLPKPENTFFFFSVTAKGELILVEHEVPQFYYSFNNGDSWTVQSTLPMRLHTIIAGTKNGDLFCGQASPDSVTDVAHNYAIHSSDNGQTWDSTTLACYFYIASNDYVCGVTQDSFLLSSANHGSTWQLVPMPDGSLLSYATAYPDLKGNMCWSLSDRAIRYSTINRAAEEINVANSRITSILVDNDGLVTVLGQGLFSRSTDKGNSWLSATNISDSLFPGSFSELTRDSSGGLIGVGYFYIYRSTDRGMTWEVMNTTPLNFPSMILTSPNGDLFARSTDSNIIRSTDLGRTWKQSAEGLTSSFATSLICDASGMLYSSESQNIYRSTDNGDSWQFMINIKDPYLAVGIVTTSNISCLLAAPDGSIYAGTTHDGIICSTDKGISWKVKSEHLDSAGILGLFSAPNGDIYGISKKGSLSDGIIYRSHDGTRWYNANDGLFDPATTRTIAFAPDGSVYLGSTYDGIWRSNGLVNAVSLNNKTVENLSLSISPNPASSQITASYSLPEQSFVKLELSDELGRTVRTIENHLQDGGVHNESIHFNGLTEGIYLLRLSTPTANITEKIVINK